MLVECRVQEASTWTLCCLEIMRDVVSMIPNDIESRSTPLEIRCSPDYLVVRRIRIDICRPGTNLALQCWMSVLRCFTRSCRSPGMFRLSMLGIWLSHLQLNFPEPRYPIHTMRTISDSHHGCVTCDIIVSCISSHFSRFEIQWLSQSETGVGISHVLRLLWHRSWCE